MPTQVNIHFARSGIARGREQLRRYATRLLQYALAAEGLPDAELTVLFCSEARIHTLNRDFRNQDKPTDVLSFPSGEDPELIARKGGYLGDLALCLPVCARQAPELGRTPASETGLLLVHGFLHLLGYDHQEPQEAQRMWARMEELLTTSAIEAPDIAVKDVR